ncbi:MAG: LysR-family transcriptional regulator [Frankiales bacterium]|nr:LysR-family transcriptional regulator [Frankiales bacterium]
MELRALEYFVAVAEERHFTRAAARMLVSQSGLSAAIKSLEGELQATLFQRTTRRVQLTAAGAALLPEARRALAAARAGAEAVSAVHSLQRGTVSVGVMQQMGLVELPRVLARYHQRYPGVELRLRQASARDLHRLLLEGELDLAVASPPDPVDDRLVAVELFHTPLVLACRADDPFTKRKTVAAGDLVGRNLVGFPRGWVIRTLADRKLHESGVHVDFNIEINDTSTLLDLVEAGLGVALIADALATQRRALRTVRLSGPAVDWTISAVAVAPGPTNPAAGELWQLITRLAHRTADTRQGRPAPAS